MKKKKLQCSVPTLLLAGVLCLTLAACGAKQSSDMPASDTDSAASAALPVKAMNAKRVYICCTFGLFTDGLDRFDEAYEKCYFDKVVTTNLTYQLPELKSKPYYLEADMSKFLASIIDFMNHDSSMMNVYTPTEKIQEILAKYNNRENMYITE